MAFGIFWIVHTKDLGFYGSAIYFSLALLCPTLAILLSIILVIMIMRAWIHGPNGAWKLGVKDLAYIDGSYQRSLPIRVSFFGKRRKLDDDIRMRLIWAGLKTGLVRRIPCVNIDFRSTYLTRVSHCGREVETLKFALCRNVMAAVLLFILIAQSFRLFFIVFNPPVLQETWDYLQTNVSETNPTLSLSTLSFLFP